MARKGHSDENILRLLREIEVHIHGGMDVVGACRKASASDKTYYAWRKRFGGMGRSQLSEMKSLQKENDRLKKIVAELDKLILKESHDFYNQRSDERSATSAVIHTRRKLNISERRTCKVLSISRPTLNYKPVQQDDKPRRSDNYR